MRISSFTKPGEVLFNLIALIHLGALLLNLLFIWSVPQTALHWWFWVILAGPLAFWVAFIAILIRLRRSGYRPHFRFRRGLSITGSRDCYREYVRRFGHDTLLWIVPGAVAWSALTLFAIMVIVATQ